MTEIGKWLKKRPPPPAGTPSAVAGVVLRTERLLLREFVPGDWEALLDYRRDPRVLKYTHRTAPYSPSEVRFELARVCRQRDVRPRTEYELALVLTARNLLIGNAGLYLWPDRCVALLGFELRADCWGQGYATEAAREVIRFGFEDLGLRKIEAGSLPENLASVRVLEKLGMTFEGMRRGFPGAPEAREVPVYRLYHDHWLRAPGPQA